MRKLILLLTIFFSASWAFAQSPITISVTPCFTPNPVTLPYIGDVAGKPAYDGVGNYGGIAAIQLSILWDGGSNLWIIQVSGQPIYSNASDTPFPPASGWSEIQVLAGCPPGSAPPTLSGADLLPVALIGFTGKRNKHQVLLKWITASELNNDYFSVERSVDGRIFEPISQVKGIGTSDAEHEYQFIDDRPYFGINYYRLRQVDYDGTEEIHKVISIKMDGEDQVIHISPNPSSDLIRIQLNKSVENNTIIKILDINGRLAKQVYLQAGNSASQIDVSGLANGMYTVQFQVSTKTEIQRFIKN